MFFIATCVEKPHSLDKRKKKRPALLARVFESVSVKAVALTIGQNFA
jgi:hypothetical protein